VAGNLGQFKKIVEILGMYSERPE